MKIAYVTVSEILGIPNTGGIQFSKRNIELLGRAFGEKNIFPCVITKEQKNIEKAVGNTAVFFSAREKVDILKNALSGRLQFGREIEDAVLDYLVQHQYDAVFIDDARMGYLQKRLPDSIFQILFMQNIEKDYIQNRIYANKAYVVLKKAFEKNEMLAVQNADMILSLNYRDALQLKKYYNRTPDLILPITMDDFFDVQKAQEYEKRDKEKPAQLLFVGSFFPPNEKSIVWFVENVMPYVTADFTIVGRGFEQLEKRLTRKNVHVVGTVGDIAPYYYSSDAVVSPILFGNGMKVKTAEALMFGKPLFASDEALEGYDVEGISGIWRCNNAQTYIDSIQKHAYAIRRSKYETGIRKLFLEKYCTNNYVTKIFNSIAGRK